MRNQEHQPKDMRKVNKPWHTLVLRSGGMIIINNQEQDTH